MNRRNCLYLPLAAAALAAITILGPGTSAAEENPCAEDIVRLCKGIAPGRGAVVSCLEEHEAELSGPCKEYEKLLHGRRAERREQMMELMQFRQACNEDIVTFCKDVQPGEGRIINCLIGHRDELSVPCRHGIMELKDQ